MSMHDTEVLTGVIVQIAAIGPTLENPEPSVGCILKLVGSEGLVSQHVSSEVSMADALAVVGELLKQIGDGRDHTRDH